MAVAGTSLGLSVDVESIRPRTFHTGVKFNFLELPDDVLFSVFEKCDIKTLGRLSRVCHKLNTLIKCDSVWLSHRSASMLVGSSAAQCNSCLKFNSLRRAESLPLKEQFRLSHNWEEKKYKEKVLCRLGQRQLPWIQFTGNTLWISTNNTIKCYNVQKNGRIRENCDRRLSLPQVGYNVNRVTRSDNENQHHSTLTNEDICRFVVKENIAISGCRDGSLYIFDCDSGSCLGGMCKLHETDTHAVDLHGNCIISGSRDKTVKITSMLNDDFDDSDFKTAGPVQATIDMHDRIWSVSMAPDGRNFTVGTAGCRQTAVSVWNVERAERLLSLGSYRYGAGVLDMKHEDNNTLLTCGYDAYLRMWDLRSGQCVEERHEPYDTTLYCLQTDRNVTMVTGTARYGMIRLWDKRKPESVQKYFLSQKSPVYSLAFDSSRLFAALDLSINMMDFTVLPT